MQIRTSGGKNFPELGRIVPEFGNKSIRELIDWNYRIVYKIHPVKIRSPYVIRPWQHVLEPLTGYLTLAAKLYTEGAAYAQGWNFGPDDSDARNVEWITDTICKLWGKGASFSIDNNPQPHEANYLKLDCSKSKSELNWIPKWNIETTLKTIVDWNKSFIAGDNIRIKTDQQITDDFV